MRPLVQWNKAMCLFVSSKWICGAAGYLKTRPSPAKPREGQSTSTENKLLRRQRSGRRLFKSHRQDLSLAQIQMGRLKPGVTSAAERGMFKLGLCTTGGQSLLYKIACGSDCKLLHANSKECSPGTWKIKDVWSTGVFTKMMRTRSKGSLLAVHLFTLNCLYRRSSTEQKPTGSSILPKMEVHWLAVTCFIACFILPKIVTEMQPLCPSAPSNSAYFLVLMASHNDITLMLYYDMAADTVLHFSSSSALCAAPDYWPSLLQVLQLLHRRSLWPHSH